MPKCAVKHIFGHIKQIQTCLFLVNWRDEPAHSVLIFERRGDKQTSASIANSDIGAWGWVQKK